MKDSSTGNGVQVASEGLNDDWNFWYSELNNGVSGTTLRVSRVLESYDSEFQRIDVIHNKDYGKLLVLYGSLMVAENDNNAYNEMLAHVPLFVHPAPKEVLVVGGGDCGTLTEVMKHPEVTRCTMCELDKEVVEVSKRHFPQLTRGLSDPRANLVFNDGKVFIRETKDRYDVIMLDLSDPVGPAADLFQRPFHQDVYDKLNDDGILVAQSESPFYNAEIVKAMYTNLKSIFPIVRMYICHMPIYPSAIWSFAFCSKKYDPIADFDRSRWQSQTPDTRYYNDEVHTGAFALPQFCKKLVG